MEVRLIPPFRLRQSHSSSASDEGPDFSFFGKIQIRHSGEHIRFRGRGRVHIREFRSGHRDDDWHPVRPEIEELILEDGDVVFLLSKVEFRETGSEREAASRLENNLNAGLDRLGYIEPANRVCPEWD